MLNTATVSGAGAVGGAITVDHDGRYGDLSGKTVAIEPSTGFSFDTRLEPGRDNGNSAFSVPTKGDLPRGSRADKRPR